MTKLMERSKSNNNKNNNNNNNNNNDNNDNDNNNKLKAFDCDVTVSFCCRVFLKNGQAKVSVSSMSQKLK